jgi:hypothetical protein
MTVRKKATATPQGKTSPRKLQLPLSRKARKELRELCKFARQELSPSSLAALRTFAAQYGYRAADVLEAVVVLTAVNRGEATRAE